MLFPFLGLFFATFRSEASIVKSLIIPKGDFTKMNNIKFYEKNNIGKATYIKDADYLNHRTGRYTIWSKRIAVKFWVQVDYYDLFEGNITDIGRTFLLINSIDYNNIVCKMDAHSHRQVPLDSYKQLMDLVGISNRDTFRKFFNKLVEKDIIAEIYENDVIDKNKKFRRFVINPAFGMKDKGISSSVFKLFYKSISPLISSKTNTDLSRMVEIDEGSICSCDTEVKQPLLTASPNDNGDSMTPLEIFHEYILNGNEPLTYIKKFGMTSSPVRMDTDMYYLVNGTEKNFPQKPSNEDITEYRSWFIDIDAGRDEDGRYFDDNEVRARKQYMCETVLKALDKTTPTLVVETRNGYHLYWSCGKNISASEWNRIEHKLIDVVSIADRLVKDASRVMRLPKTNWVKKDEGFAPFEVDAITGNPVRYGVEDFEAIIDVHADSITSSCNSYLEKYPSVAPKKAQKSSKKVVSFSDKTSTCSKPSESITNIKSLSTSSAPALKKTITDKDEARNIARSINMSNWLHIDTPSSFRCILPGHDDKHPSASIYNNNDHDRYFCHCFGGGRGLDSIDLVRYVSGCSYQDAVEYLCCIQGYEYKAKRRKSA